VDFFAPRLVRDDIGEEGHELGAGVPSCVFQAIVAGHFKRT
jgi:hypothetical protein